MDPVPRVLCLEASSGSRVLVPVSSDRCIVVPTLLNSSLGSVARYRHNPGCFYGTFTAVNIQNLKKEQKELLHSHTHTTKQEG